MSKNIQRVYEVRRGNHYEVDPTCDPITNPDAVEKCFLHDMIAKHYWKSLYIRSIKRINNYDGTCNYIVTYQNGTKITGRAIYTIKE